jgi:N-formylmaleamate deformylase
MGNPSESIPMTPDTFVHGGTISANNIRQHYLRYGGKGAPLVIVPGIVSPAIMWDFIGQRLGGLFDVYIIDVRGRGLSETGDDLDYGLDAYADDLVGFADALGLGKYTIVGHSMGARIALRTALKAPDTLAQIVMVDPPVSGPGRRAYPVPLERMTGMLAKAKRGELWDATKADTLWTEHSNRMRAEWMHTCNETAIVKSHQNFHEEDIFPDFGKVKVPTALMVANKGGTVQADDVAEIQGLLPSITLDHVDTGHMIPFENTAAFITSLGKLLGKMI